MRRMHTPAAASARVLHASNQGHELAQAHVPGQAQIQGAIRALHGALAACSGRRLWQLRRAGIEAGGFAYSVRTGDFSTIRHRLVARLVELAGR